MHQDACSPPRFRRSVAGVGAPASGRMNTARSYSPMLHGGGRDLYAGGGYGPPPTQSFTGEAGQNDFEAQAETEDRAEPKVEHCFHILMWLWVLVSLGLCACLLHFASVLVEATSFLVVSLLAGDNGYPSFFALALVLASLVLLGILVLGASFAFCVEPLKHSERALRTLQRSGLCVGILLLAAAGLSAAVMTQAAPHITRTANLLCQEIDVWGCTSKGGGRRLSLANVTLSAEESIRRDMASDDPQRMCSLLKHICQAPPGFNASIACVCNGNWDFTPPHGKRRLLNTPWQGTVGAFCGPWGGAMDADWCFVSPHQRCAQATKAVWMTSKGVEMIRSTGPCTRSVDSRSQVVLDGMDLTTALVAATAIVGVAFGVFGALVLVLANLAPPNLAPRIQPAEFPDGARRIRTPRKDHPRVEQRFSEAQREAVRKLTDGTPDELKLLLYGFHKQATEGDAPSQRPAASASRVTHQRYDSWLRHRGLPATQAMEGYIQSVALLR